MLVAVYGATGYSGIEALKLLTARSDLEVAWIGSDSQKGKKLAEVNPLFRDTPYDGLRFSEQDAKLPAVDYALFATPHGFARRVAPTLIERGIKVIDFSGDHRLPQAVYEQWYGKTAEGAATEAVYGLPEINRDAIRKATLVANPGCYATAAALALIPAVEAGIVDARRLVVDAKSGVSGAGRSPQQTTHFVEVSESLKAYKVGAHQHTPEIEQTLAQVSRRRGGDTEGVRVLMTTQLLPIKRGIYVTAYGALLEDMSAQEVAELYWKRYEHEPFVKVLPLGAVPEIRLVTGTNECHIGLHVDARTKTLLVMSALDNLIKGAAGQAIQNLNLLARVEERAGLTGMAWW